MGHKITKHAVSPIRSSSSSSSSNSSSSSTDTLNFNQQNITVTTVTTSQFLHHRQRRKVRRRFYRRRRKNRRSSSNSSSSISSSPKKTPELYRLARYGTLESFVSRLQTHPNEVSIKIDDGSLPIYNSSSVSSSFASSTHDDTASSIENEITLEYGSTPLHLLITRRPPPPAQIVQHYLSIHAQSTHCMTLRDGRLPLHIATYSSCSPDIVQSLINAFPESLNVVDYYGWNVFHIVARFGVPQGVLQVLTSSCTSSPPPPAALSSSSLSLMEKAIRTRDNDGRTPLHICSDYFAGINLTDFHTLLTLAPDVAFMETNKAASRSEASAIRTLMAQTQRQQKQPAAAVAYAKFPPLHSSSNFLASYDNNSDDGGVLHNGFATSSSSSSSSSFILPKRNRKTNHTIISNNQEEIMSTEEYTPLEILCHEYASTIVRAKHQIESFQHQWNLDNHSTKEHYFKSLRDDYYEEHSKLIQKLLVDMIEFREFWEKSVLLIQCMYNFVSSSRNDDSKEETAEEKGGEFSMLHSCLYLTPTWCPSVLTQLVILIRPYEVSLLHDGGGKDGQTKNLPLHIAASVVASAAAGRQRQLDEQQEKMGWKKNKEEEEGNDFQASLVAEAATANAQHQQFQNKIVNSFRLPYFSLDDTLHYHNNDNRHTNNEYEMIKEKEGMVDTLLECYPQAASIPNGAGFLPFQLIVGSECLGGDIMREEKFVLDVIKEDQDGDTNDEKFKKCKTVCKEENGAEMNKNMHVLMRENTKKKQENRPSAKTRSSPTWSEGVGSVLLAYPPALESLDLSEEIYPYILSRFTDEVCIKRKRRSVADFNTLFILLKERPDLVYT